VRDDRDQGYGRVLLPDGVKPEDISAHFVCGDVQHPVRSWTYGSAAVYNKDCDDCGNNIEFMSYSVSAPAGTYRCAFTFDFGPQTIACPANNDGNDAIAPIVLSDSTQLTSAQTKEITVLAPSEDAPTWCYFKHFDEPGQNGFQGTWQAYGRILPPGLATPAQIAARLICGASDVPAANWTVMREAEQNLFCPGNGYEACGANNLEYMSAPLIDNAHILDPGSYSCAFRFDVGGKSYVCSTYRDASNTGGQPVLLVPGKILTSAESWGITVQ
ncbi:MAG: hypothetical protein IJ268_07105, partial [Proteobacteria bacterium]|nr:hypothetical protein [Pseudomonadota bacterium]